MLSLQVISDRLEIQQLAVDYCNAIDSRDFAALDRVFSPDAYIDYRAMGGIDGAYPQVRAWLGEALATFPAYQHMIGNHAIELSGDEASGRILCFNPMAVDLADGSRRTFFLGLWYHDRYRRTEQGWRIARRSEEKSWTFNVPDGLPV
ncbi:nuclear transport factor 2 family protein [Pseudomonas citronellolis]|uniref:nuclear transport factor 2 family protein n=1 Tax=Pseudomonas citronellolis TaxID=53408 RepID=UPI0023E36D3C|nr:nuclear transport factor 2 family protein [Pseudomonas citronellolis]MDF3932878.1 nuclear transport factor 2 family protein [Pseudomonas citronellolis]